MDEVKLAYHKMELEKCQNDQHRAAKQLELEAIPNTDYYNIITNMKTQFAPLIANELLVTEKSLPTTITELFDKINVILNPRANAEN